MTTLLDHGPSAVVVLDSNVVLDWLLFRDPSVQGLGGAITSRAVRWCATSAMRNELEHVLTLNSFQGSAGSARDVLTGWDRWAEPVAPPTVPLSFPLRCTDPDDQKFIDLALACRPAWLLSRDKALLRLARRARAQGVEILQPSAFSLERALTSSAHE